MGINAGNSFNSYSKVISFGNGRGFYDGGDDSHISFVSSFNDTIASIYSTRSEDLYVNQILDANSGGLYYARGDVYSSQIATSNSYFDDATTIAYTHNIAGGDGSVCSNVVDEYFFCKDLVGSNLDSTYDAFTYTGVASDSSITASKASITASDLTDFSESLGLYKVWGISEGSGFPDNSETGACDAACIEWDLLTSSSENQLLNRSNDFSSLNETFVAGGPCPSAVNGNKVVNGGVGHQFLVNAIEIMNDSLGDNDGQCESNEACIYAPNVGAYQGHGDFKSNGTCNFSDGIISNVTMFAYPINGK